MSKPFKILTHVGERVPWPHNSYNLYRNPSLCPRYVVYKWCERRKRWRKAEDIAVGVPYASWGRWGVYRYTRGELGHNGDYAVYGKQLATQNNIPWIDDFDPSWKLHDVMLLRLKGKI